METSTYEYYEDIQFGKGIPQIVKEMSEYQHPSLHPESSALRLSTWVEIKLETDGRYACTVTSMVRTSPTSEKQWARRTITVRAYDMVIAVRLTYLEFNRWTKDATRTEFINTVGFVPNGALYLNLDQDHVMVSRFLDDRRS